ncbi:MAG: cytidylate kinase-like family protein, partial [Lachnospiraceae bacterium]|nr:cytidylate kinase-like family protein [Lachnospiraceae bacterium]
MSNQLIVSVSREYGSGGHIVAAKIAAKLNLPLYDYNLLNKIASDKNLNLERLEKYDEKPKNKLFSRNVRGFSNSPEENIAYLQFEYLRREAESGKSFVVLGRCAEAVLRDYDCMIPIFILADRDYKIERTMKCEKISLEEAEQLVHYQNKKRKEYHNYHC